MSKSTSNLERTRIQRLCTLWTHDDNFSKEDIVFNGEKFPGLPTAPGTLLQIVNIKPNVVGRDFQGGARAQAISSRDHCAGVSSTNETTKPGRRGSITITLDENGSAMPACRDVDVENAYVFAVAEITPDLKSKYANLQLSVSERIAKVFGLRNRMQVIVAEADEETHEAHHVEVVFRDEYLARADMWRLAISELSKRTVYRGQKLLFMGTIKATIKHIYINGQSKQSGYFSPKTKPVFRSESARYVLFLQMSKEMWDVDTEGAGEIMFNRVVSGFLPDLFKRWLRINARHLVTIILFTRMQYDGDAVPDDPSGRFDQNTDRFHDYYRVVVSDMASVDWIQILYKLKKEFRTFLKDVSLVIKPNIQQGPLENKTDSPEANVIVTGKPSSASQGNILEAISLAAVQFSKDYIDRDLVRTGISVVVVTPGTGVFEVDYNMLKLTTDTLMGSGIGIDLVCLSPMPLHSVPLFKYQTPQVTSATGTSANQISHQQKALPSSLSDHEEKTPRQFMANFNSKNYSETAATTRAYHIKSDPVPKDPIGCWRFAMPYWIDVSFWSGASDDMLGATIPRATHKIVKKSRKKNRNFSLRCRLHELQMMGVMENELGSIAIPYLKEDSRYRLNSETFDEINQDSVYQGLAAHRAPITASGSYSSRGDRELANMQLDDTKIALKTCMEAYDEEVFTETEENPFTSDGRLGNEAFGKQLCNPSDDPRQSAPSQGIKVAPSATNRPVLDAQTFHLSHDRLNRFQERPSGYDGRLDANQTRVGVPRADVLQRQNISTRDILNKYHVDSLGRSISKEPSGSPRSGRTTPDVSVEQGEASSSTKRISSTGSTNTKTITVRNEIKQRPSNWIFRQISFGGKAAMATPTIAGATIDISHGKVKPAMLTVEKNQKGAIAERLASSRLTTTEKPSKPIAIRTASRAGLPSSESPSSDHTGRSAETVKMSRQHQTASQSSSVVKDRGSTFLLAGSRALGDPILPKPALSSSGGAKEVSRLLSSANTIVPWAILTNPCNPKRNSLDPRNQFRRWHHVFPRTLRTGSMKWRSLCSPAAVPLTHEWFPTSEQIASEYSENPYRITQNDDDDLLEVPKTRHSLIRELVAFRLSHGFQIIVGSAVAEFSGLPERSLASILAPDYMSCDGDTIFMSLGDSIHQLACVAGGEVEVKRYNRKTATDLDRPIDAYSCLPYRAYIRTAFEDNFEQREILLQSPRKDYNWNFIDTFLAGYHDELSDVLRFWRARFVLIPVEIPMMHRRPLAMLAEDSEEEIRLEGIRKLTQLWQRHRFISPEERHHQAPTSKKQKDPNPLAIEYHTRDPSAIVTTVPETSLFGDLDHDIQTSLFSDSGKYQTSNIDLKTLAEDLQGEKGIQMIDRRWHWKLHHTCFLGFDLVNWLLSNFRDLETRDEAVDFGNELMTKGLFVHVQKRHHFRDGNFFFQIAAEYRAPRPDSRMGGWFGMRKIDKSVPLTPLGEGSRVSPLLPKSNNGTKSRPGTADSSSTSESSHDGEKTPKRNRRKATLSRVMRYDVDSRKRSYRPEIISLHYDRLHNPDNCYHIRIDWMNVTAKLIEDAIVTWATSVEKYGLKLVEVPIAEVAKIVDHHPFRSPYTIKLALQPPPGPPESAWDATYMTSHYGKSDNFAYHKALLRKLNFVLDMEAASSFPVDVEVSYSWGSNDYRYTQFIHRSGTLLAQITDDGNLLLLANRLAHSRSKDTSRIRVTDPFDYKKASADGAQSSRLPSTPAAERGNVHRSPFSSPLARPVQDSNVAATAQLDQNRQFATTPLAYTSTQTPEQIKDDVEAFCSNAALLSAFYSEAFRLAPSPSPRIVPTLDHNIPNLGLPPAISIREASPANTGWSLSSTFTPRAGMTESGITARRQGSDGSMSTSSKRGSVAEGGGKEHGLRRQGSRGSMGDESERGSTAM